MLLTLQLAALGGFILIFGFLAFNGSSQGAISNPGDGVAVAMAIKNTVMSGTSGAFTTMFLNKLPCFGDRKWSFATTLNGALAGMVSSRDYTKVWFSWINVFRICLQWLEMLIIKSMIDTLWIINISSHQNYTVSKYTIRMNNTLSQWLTSFWNMNESININNTYIKLPRLVTCQLLIRFESSKGFNFSSSDYYFLIKLHF